MENRVESIELKLAKGVTIAQVTFKVNKIGENWLWVEGAEGYGRRWEGFITQSKFESFAFPKEIKLGGIYSARVKIVPNMTTIKLDITTGKFMPEWEVKRYLAGNLIEVKDTKNEGDNYNKF